MIEDATDEVANKCDMGNVPLEECKKKIMRDKRHLMYNRDFFDKDEFGHDRRNKEEV